MWKSFWISSSAISALGSEEQSAARGRNGRR
jgi:hypothetical protein